MQYMHKPIFAGLTLQPGMYAASMLTLGGLLGKIVCFMLFFLMLDATAAEYRYIRAILVI